MLGFLKNVLGGGGGDRESEGAEPVEHEGFTIVATPRKASGGWSTEGRIRKVIDGEAKEAHFIRADTSTSREAAIALSVSKARKIIDEQGARVPRPAGLKRDFTYPFPFSVRDSESPAESCSRLRGNDLVHAESAVPWTSQMHRLTTGRPRTETRGIAAIR